MDTRRFILSAALGIFGLPLSTVPSLSADACSFTMPRDVVVSLSRRNGEVQLDNRKTRAELRTMQRGKGQAGAFGAGWTPVGLTLTELKYAMKVRVEAVTAGQGRYCARLTEVAADIGFDAMNVFIANRFKPGTCAYRSINDHELTHVAVFRETLDVYHPRMLRRLERTARSLGPVRASSPDAAARQLQAKLRTAVDPLFAEMNRTMHRNNGRLDTPERYRAEQSRCAEW